MRKYLLITIVLISALSFSASAQVGIGIGPGYGYRRSYHPAPPRKVQKRPSAPKFDPVVHFSIGYGFPNLDANQLVQFYDYSRGPISQTGPVTGAIDYQFSRSSSIGVMVTHGKTSASYYNYGNSYGTPDIMGSQDNWSVMLNFMNYIPTGSDKVSPYLRTAVGLNIWNQGYTDAYGGKLDYISEPSQFAYQIGLGVNFSLTKNTGLFMEAGYGKYILHGGLSFKL